MRADPASPASPLPPLSALFDANKHAMYAQLARDAPDLVKAFSVPIAHSSEAADTSRMSAISHFIARGTAWAFYNAAFMHGVDEENASPAALGAQVAAVVASHARARVPVRVCVAATVDARSSPLCRALVAAGLAPLPVTSRLMRLELDVLEAACSTVGASAALPPHIVISELHAADDADGSARACFGEGLARAFAFPCAGAHVLRWYGRVWSRVACGRTIAAPIARIDTGRSGSSASSRADSLADAAEGSPPSCLTLFVATDVRTGAMIGGSVLCCAASVAAIYNVWTAKAARGAGVGRHLSLACVERARALRYRRVLLEASPSGRPVYVRIGFVDDTRDAAVDGSGVAYRQWVKVDAAAPVLLWPVQAALRAWNSHWPVVVCSALLVCALAVFMLLMWTRRVLGAAKA
jgi:GNAT superfamily N-acetyltransferase